jgi:hypothetical protein
MSMAGDMAARIAADEGAGLAQSGEAGGVPGSEGGQAPQAGAPAAAPSTPDSTPTSGPPDTIPYARFKEVNDRLQSLSGFETLASYGYDSDSLGRLAAFEAQYLQDPVGTWKAMADNIDLPQELKDAMEAHLNSSDQADVTPSSDGPKPVELSPEDRARLDYVDRVRETELERDRNARLDHVVSIWTNMDKQDRIETPEHIKLMAIMAAAQSGQQFPTLEALADAARRQIVDYRSGVLGDVVQRTGRGGSPAPLPGSLPVPSGPVKFDTLRAASRAAEAAIQRGELPSL